MASIRSILDAFIVCRLGSAGIAVAALCYASLMEHEVSKPLIWHAGSLVICSSAVVHRLNGAPLTRLYGGTAGKESKKLKKNGVNARPGGAADIRERFHVFVFFYDLQSTSAHQGGEKKNAGAKKSWGLFAADAQYLTRSHSRLDTGGCNLPIKPYKQFFLDSGSASFVASGRSAAPYQNRIQAFASVS